MLMFGEDHPEMATVDSNIAIILHTIKDFKNSLFFLESTRRVHERSAICYCKNIVTWCKCGVMIIL